MSRPVLLPIRSRNNLIAALALAVLLSSAALDCRAAPIIDTKAAGTGTNVLFNQPNLVTNAGPETAMTVQGATNQGSFVLDFTANANIAGTGGVGQAVIQTDPSGGTFSTLVITPHSANDLPMNLNSLSFFTRIIFNLTGSNLDGANPNTGTVDISVFGTGFGSPVVFAANPISSAGSNFFDIQAGPGESITKVTIASTLPLKNIKQVRIDGLNGTPVDDGDEQGDTPGDGSHVPEPGTILIWSILGIGGLIGARRMRRRQTDRPTA